MPAITLLPAKMVNDLRVIANYLVRAPGDNHTGMIIHNERIQIWYEAAYSDYPSCHVSRYYELVCSDSLQSVGEGYEFTPSEQSRAVFTPTICKTTHYNDSRFYFTSSFVFYQIPKKSSFASSCKLVSYLMYRLCMPYLVIVHTSPLSQF